MYRTEKAKRIIETGVNSIIDGVRFEFLDGDMVVITDGYFRVYTRRDNHKAIQLGLSRMWGDTEELAPCG